MERTGRGFGGASRLLRREYVFLTLICIDSEAGVGLESGWSRAGIGGRRGYARRMGGRLHLTLLPENEPVR